MWHNWWIDRKKEGGRFQHCSFSFCIISRCSLLQYVPDVKIILEGEAVKYCFKAFRVNHKCCTGDLMKNAVHRPLSLKQSTDGPLGVVHVSVASGYNYKKRSLWGWHKKLTMVIRVHHGELRSKGLSMQTPEWKLNSRLIGAHSNWLWAMEVCLPYRSLLKCFSWVYLTVSMLD